MTTDARTVGLSAETAIQDPELAASIQRFVTAGEAGSLVVPVAMRVGPVVVPPRILALEPVKGLPGGRWAAIIMSPLSETDAVVSGLFMHAMWWSVFVVVSMTGILVLTSVTMIRGRMKLERMRHDILTRELSEARDIQLAWLPDAAQPPAGLLVAAVNLPANHISGDFYDWFTLEDGRVAMTIGDVTGHGMSAAFLMATTQLLVRNTMGRISDPGQCLGEVNRQLCTQAFRGQFVTMALLVLDPEEGTIEMSAAGHPPPLVRSREGFRRWRLSRNWCWAWTPRRFMRRRRMCCIRARRCCCTRTAWWRRRARRGSSLRAGGWCGRGCGDGRAARDRGGGGARGEDVLRESGIGG